MSCQCCLKKYINLFSKKKDGKFPDQNEILNTVLGACDEYITILYKNCLLGEQDIKLRTYIFTEMIKITGSNYMLVHDSKIKSLSEKRPLLQFVVQMNNIPFMCILIKHGANIHLKNSMRQNILHICVGYQNKNLMKYFIDKKVNIDELDADDETPLIFALKLNYFDMAKMLIENDANCLIKNEDNISPIIIILNMLCNDESIYFVKDCCIECKKKDVTELLIIILKTISKKNGDSYGYEIKKILSRNFIEYGKCEYVELLVNNCDNIIDEFDMIKYSFETYNKNKMEILRYLISSDKYDYKRIINNGVTIFDYALFYLNYECIEIMLNKYDDLLNFENKNYLNNNKHNRHNKHNKMYTIYDYLFTEDSIIIDAKIKLMYKNKKYIIKTLELLIKNGLDINEKYGDYLPIEYAIRYVDNDVLGNMIDMGVNLDLEIIKKQVFTIFGNNDLLTFAVKFHKFEKLKFLIEKNVTPKYINISSEESVPICLIMSIMKDNYIIFDYLYDKYIDKTNKNIRGYLIKMIEIEALDNMDEFLKIMQYDFSEKKSELGYVDRLIQRFIPFNNNHKEKIYLQIYELILLLTSFFDYDNDMYAWIIMDKYNYVLDLIAPNNDLLYSLIDILVYVGGFQSDFIITKYLYIINNLIEENNDKFKKSLNCDSIKKFCIYVDNKCLINNFIKIKNFGIDIKYKLATTSKKEIYDNMCKISENFDVSSDFDNYTCNDYGCKKCANIFHKENKNPGVIFYDICIHEDAIDKNDGDIYPLIFREKHSKKKKKKSPSTSSDSFSNNDSKLEKNEKKQNVNSDWSVDSDDLGENLTKNITKNITNCYQDDKNNYYDSIEYITKKKLFKLYFPVKQDHYDNVYKSLLTSPKYDNNSNFINFSYNEKIFTIFKNFTISQTCKYNQIFKKPTRWIKYYAPNIGKDDKWDFYHEIPFWIDNVLCQFNCYEEEIDDVNNKNMKSKLFYFNGIIQIENYITRGVFEYFINGTGTIFHRMFRQFHKLSPQMQILFSNNDSDL